MDVYMEQKGRCNTAHTQIRKQTRCSLWTLNFQYCEKISFYCLTSLSWYFAITAKQEFDISHYFFSFSCHKKCPGHLYYKVTLIVGEKRESYTVDRNVNYYHYRKQHGGPSRIISRTVFTVPRKAERDTEMIQYQDQIYYLLVHGTLSGPDGSNIF